MSADAAEPGWLPDLTSPAAYPHDPGATARAIQRIDTHISHVFLTGGRAYKLRRPVRLSFLDFSEPRERLADCLREVKLNRRLAGDVYLGIAPILEVAGRVHVGEVRETPSLETGAVEHCVVMRRLPEGRNLRSMIERGDASGAHIDAIAARLARFHADHGLAASAQADGGGWLAQTTGPARANFAALAHVPASLAPVEEVREASHLAEAFAAARRADFELRRERSRVVDGHGDLHCEHVWFEQDHSEPLMVDCLEFRDDFRCIDSASDVAFLAMDLRYRGRADLAARFLRRYARESGDYHLFSVVDYFMSYRALVRAKVASLVATDDSLPAGQREHARQSVRRHLDLGLEFLKPRGRGRVVLTCGTIGTGKSTVAEALADLTGGVVISSDRVRRTPDAASAPAPYGAGRYGDAARTAVYERLLAEARPVVASGRTAILDATYSRRAWRDAAASWAAGHAAGCALVEVVAGRDDVIERLTARMADANTASEAGPGLYDSMRAEFEGTTEWPAASKATIDTTGDHWHGQVASAANQLGLVHP